jgi:Ca-activated chloride channel family protein
MRRLSVLFLTGFATFAHAQDQPNTVLVMDGSGSMWGQVEGVAKITIAQQVVGTLLSDFPPEQGLGLTVYGHRERGECTDIETVVAPAPGTAAQITTAVNAIKPLGKTPMTDAVIAAAEALRYTEEKATVILVSDGVETCNPDPCAAARLLEEAGIDFTAHVIGFDVGSDPEALAQMQCIADETGGQFLTAETADQLTAALTQVAAAPEPDPEPVVVPTSLSAVIEGTDTLVTGPVIWDITSDAGTVLSDADGNPLTTDLPEGSYTATAYSAALETALSRQFIAIGDPATVEIAFPEPQITARLVAPATAVAGSTIEVGWDGPNGSDDYIGIGAEGVTGGAMWRNWTPTADGNPLTLLVPPDPGPHVIRYFLRDGRESIGSVDIMVTPAEATLSAPSSAPAGSTITVEWTGPDYKDDYIGIGKVGATSSASWENFTYTRDGSSLTLQVPPDAGEYLITYFIHQDRTPLVSVPFTATALTARILAPAEAAVGSVVEIGWEGPDYTDDYIGIGKVGTSGGASWENFTYTREGNPLSLQMPGETGEYLITYFVHQDRTPLVQVPITLTPVEVTLNAPAQAETGSTVDVAWTGPGTDGDFIGIGPVGASGGNAWKSFVYTRDGNPARLRVPGEAGEYTITYFLDEDNTPLAQIPISLVTPQVAMQPPAETFGGATIEVPWTGPNNEGDYIGIGKADATGGNRWKSYAYTRDGNPARITVPAEPGDYLVTYFLAKDQAAIAEVPMTVRQSEARLVVPPTAAAGETVEIGWVGPDNPRDYIGIGKVDATGGSQWQSYAYTENGNPVSLKLPDEPGNYVVRYFLQRDQFAIAEAPLVIE